MLSASAVQIRTSNASHMFRKIIKFTECKRFFILFQTFTRLLNHDDRCIAAFNLNVEYCLSYVKPEVFIFENVQRKNRSKKSVYNKADFLCSFQINSTNVRNIYRSGKSFKALPNSIAFSH